MKEMLKRFAGSGHEGNVNAPGGLLLLQRPLNISKKKPKTTAESDAFGWAPRESKKKKKKVGANQ